MQEKSVQVSLMYEIYSKASRVVVWLGEATMATDNAMDYMSGIEARKRLHPLSMGEHTESSTSRIEGLQEIISRPWFSRLWVVQEVSCAKAVTFVCGSKAVSSETVVSAVELSLGKTNWSSKQVLDLMPGISRNRSSNYRHRLHDLLLSYQQREASDPRDKIYGLLGIVDKGLITRIEIDYNKSEKELMREVIAALCYCELKSVPEP